MPAVLDTPDLDVFEQQDFELAWQLDATLPRRIGITPETAFLVRRSSPHDFQDRQIYLWIDDEPLGKIRYGESINRPVQPRRHTIRVFHTLHTHNRGGAGAAGARAMRHRHASGWLVDDDVFTRDLLACVGRA